MASPLLSTALTAFLVLLLHRLFRHIFTSPLASVPGPKLYAFTKWRLAWDDWKGQRTSSINKLHQIYGPVVRIGPNEVHFCSLSALRTIYGAGSGFERTDFYRMFDAYGKKNLFTFESVADHATRKRLVAHAYSKSAVLRGHTALLVHDKIGNFLDLIDRTPAKDGLEIFSALHYYAIDAITGFLYGSKEFGASSALQGNTSHLVLLNDIMDPARRQLSWFAVHLPWLTKWLYTRTGTIERLVTPILPMGKPATYTGIRKHALQAMYTYRDASTELRVKAQNSIIERLWNVKDIAMLDELDIASECADHLLAGIDTTSDTLMFLIWCLSLPQNAAIQRQLIDECRRLPDTVFKNGVIDLETADRLPYLDAVLKETLRLFSPLPASEPRSNPVDTVIGGYRIPGGTVCSMAPYSLHRNGDAGIFPDPLRWDPHRWLKDSKDPVLAEMKKWWWPFSSGARMCIGMQLLGDGRDGTHPIHLPKVQYADQARL
ncbi:cytochrome P450 [Plenodomus tracheiphilus IPT5]|uniref:Cytochrome P450 n=1 Tax=Plenodomus tracheiphilus IPT5 TaxID=1408161 RepID=A0A6A7B203_9PLEO|nr:cytochrome P450 [Plenodomus tracheiphilus IPT5]